MLMSWYTLQMTVARQGDGGKALWFAQPASGDFKERLFCAAAILAAY